MFLPCQFTPARLLKLLVMACLLLGGVLAGREFIRIYFGTNIHVILPGQVYRSAQLSPAELAEFIRKHGIRTVINLRGACPVCDWYMDESRVLHQLNVNQEDIFLSAGRYPPASELRRLVDVLDHGEYPMLLHCRQGADRTGISGTVVMLLQPGVSFAEASKQLSPRYGHLPISRTGNLDRYLTFYEDWLRDEHLEHSSQVFRDWLALPDCPERHQCALTLLDSTQAPAGRPFSLRVRARNLGRDTWQLKPSCGTSLVFLLFDKHGRYVYSEHAGLFRHEVLPGASIDLKLCFPKLPPGEYLLFADLSDPGIFFFQVGSEPLEAKLEVLASPAAAAAERIVEMDR